LSEKWIFGREAKLRGQIWNFEDILSAKDIISQHTIRLIVHERKYLMDYKTCYYSTNCNTIQIWSWCSRYLSSIGNRYPAIYVASYVGRKSEVKKMSTERFKNVSSCFVINLLNNKTIILLNLAEYRLILVDSAYIRRYSAWFRRIIVKYQLKSKAITALQIS